MKDIKNPLLHRREVSIVLEAASNPGHAFVQKHVADHFKSSEENVAVKLIKSSFGKREFVVDAFIYESAKDKLRIEPKKKVKKKEGSA